MSGIQSRSAPEDPGGRLSLSSPTGFRSGFGHPVLSDEGLLGENYWFLMSLHSVFLSPTFALICPCGSLCSCPDPVCLICGHVFVYLLLLGRAFFCPMKEKIFLGLQFTHLSLPGQVSQPWQLMLGGLGLCPQGCHWGQ